MRQWVADRLRSEILDGRRKPGDWLRQESVAREEGVSQTPVREALKQLVAEGLLEHVPYRGIRVVSLSFEDAEDLYAIRAVLEPMAARHAAREITAGELAELGSLQDRMLACEIPGRLKEYRDLNRRFHETIVAASRRPLLARTLGSFWAAFPTMLWSNVPGTAATSPPERQDPDAEEHAELLASLAAHDPERAEAAARRHVEAAGRSLLA
ncbi:MAG: GntR family transcriptional regulator, partial [Acidobacteria bacterium ACB2]|nr:GntR family transcriptional regulator [Acidobacteria bacterium ACB2]